MSSPLRVGIVDYLNARPLARGFRGRASGARTLGRGAEPGEPVVEPIYAPPARVADLLATGELDVGLVPSIEVLRIPGLLILPGPCVAATREVRSVLFLSRRSRRSTSAEAAGGGHAPPGVAAARRIALDHNSRTSQALLRILLAEEDARVARQPVDRELVPLPPASEGIPDGFDAALVIGDPALRVDRARFEVVDLAAWWRRVTGLPFVFAVWAVRREAWTPELAFVFERSLAAGLADLDAIAREAVAESGISLPEATAYFTENLRFWLGGEEVAGLREFYRRAAALGLATLPPPDPDQWRALETAVPRLAFLEWLS